MNSQNKIRKSMRARRRALSPAERNTYAKQFCKFFVATKFYRCAKRIACYLPNDGELDLTPLIHQAWKDKKITFLPVLHSSLSNRIMFAHYDHNSALAYNRFNIPEPDISSKDRTKPQHLDIVLTPLVAFDKNKNRIGMGGGYYDRSFAFLKNRKHWIQPKLIGCAYGFQKTNNIKKEKWDVPLNAVATEQGIVL